MPLCDLFGSLSSPTRVHSVPIHSSFFSLGTSHSTPIPLLTVEFHASPDGNLEAQFRRAAHLFKPSKMPNPVQSFVLGHMMAGIVSQIWVDKVDKGIYSPPVNAPANFSQLPMETKLSLLHSEQGTSMFRESATPNARLNGLFFPHGLAATTAMFNELEQDSVTNQRCLLHNLHATLCVFGAFGYTMADFFKSLHTGEDQETMASFLSFLPVPCTSLPANQKYESDYLAVPNPYDKNAPWQAKVGDNWQVAFSMRSFWNSLLSTHGPDGDNDCETDAAFRIALMLTYSSLRGEGVQVFFGTHPLMLDGAHACNLVSCLAVPLSGEEHAINLTRYRRAEDDAELLGEGLPGEREGPPGGAHISLSGELAGLPRACCWHICFQKGVCHVCTRPVRDSCSCGQPDCRCQLP